MDALQMSLELIIGFPEHVEIIDDLAETKLERMDDIQRNR
jgi:hypothetical protein